MSEDHLSLVGNEGPPTTPMAKDRNAKKLDKVVRKHMQVMAGRGVGMYMVPVEMGFKDSGKTFKGGAIFVNLPDLLPHLEKCAREWVGDYMKKHKK